MSRRRLVPILLILPALISCGVGSRGPNLVVSGSSTLAPMMEVVLNEYVDAGFDGRVSLDTIGSGAGFRRFINGESDVVTASRSMTDQERRSAEAAGRRPEAFIVAQDAVALCSGGGVSGDVTRRELPSLLTAERWSDLRPLWPDHPVAKYYPGVDSGTFDFMVDLVFGGDDRPILDSAGVQLSEDDHVLVQGIRGDPWALGFFGFSYYTENRESLTLLTVDGSSPGEAGYALTRPLFLYVDRPEAAASQEGEPARDFVAFVLEYVSDGRLPPGFLEPPPGVLSDGLVRIRDSRPGGSP